ncbi:MAG: efflux RND transporter periplasmic adaptor subunit [Flavobacteriales bacterium]
MKRIITIAVVAIAIIALLVVKLFSNQAAAQEKIFIYDAKQAILVEAEHPLTHTFDRSMSFLGTYEANHQNNVASDASGKLIELKVKEGDMVVKGQVLARLDNELIQLQIENAKLNIAQLKNDNNRFSSLRKDQAVSAVEAEKMELALKSAEVQLKQLQKQLKSTAIIAPFNGVVTKKLVDLGSMVMPGTPIVELTDISSLKLTVSVPERDVLKFKKGQKVIANADVYGNEEFNGNVTMIAVQADAAHNFKIQTTIQNSSKNRIMAGMYGSVSLENSTSISALAVSRKALVGSSKNPQVYVVRNGKSVLISFTAGTSDGEFIEVVSGLTKNDVVVVKGQVNLENNSNVKLAK